MLGGRLGFFRSSESLDIGHDLNEVSDPSIAAVIPEMNNKTEHTMTHKAIHN